MIGAFELKDVSKVLINSLAGFDVIIRECILTKEPFLEQKLLLLLPGNGEFFAFLRRLLINDENFSNLIIGLDN